MFNIKEEFERRINIMSRVREEDFLLIDEIADVLYEVTKSGGKIITAGNGGSAANSIHFTGDVIGRYRIERKAYAGVSLMVEPSTVSAISNDYDYKDLFARELQGIGKKGDALILFSSSANSENLVRAAREARKIGIVVIGLLGNNGGKLRVENLLDYEMSIPEPESFLTEEFAMTLSHIILTKWEQLLVSNNI